MPNENNYLRNSLARYLLGRDFFAFGTVFAVSMCCKSLCHKDLRQIRRAAFSISPYAVRVYVSPPLRGVAFVHYPDCLCYQISSITTNNKTNNKNNFINSIHLLIPYIIYKIAYSITPRYTYY